MKKWGISLALILALTGSGISPQYSVTAADKSFTDLVDSHWAYMSVQGAVSKGYVDGYADGSFAPDRPVSRAEFIKMTVTANKLAVSDSGSGEEWYVPFINAAVNAGYLTWSDFDYGDWNSPITREQMAWISARAADTSLDKASGGELLYRAAQKGLIQGAAGGQLGQDEVTTRAQSVTVIERVLTVKGGGELSVDKTA
ncbi:S-layer homology domain-containing protein, partial [Paenibacillus sp. y28]|uniref:S-layer homology domain-containing protein n=1 Tax=Paenibacillus sp. y28 TaxID=3129110 RepID=UPI003017FD61